MKKSTKLLLAGLFIGLIGIAVTMGIAIGTDAIMSREDLKTYNFSERFDTVVLIDANSADVVLNKTSGEYRADAFIKAWRPERIEIDNMLDLDVKDGVLYIGMTPFPDDFLGLFAQPYELIIDVYTPLGDDIDIRWE